MNSVEQAIRAIQNLYDLGQKVPSRPKGSKLTGDAGLKRRADELKVTEDEVRKAQKLVDPGQGYFHQELNQLFAQMRSQQRRSGVGSYFSRTHLVRLLSVDKKARSRYQKLTFQHGWTVRQLQRAIATRFGPRTHGGRRRALPQTLQEFWLDVELMCESWRRWRHELDRQRFVSGNESIGIGRLDESALSQIQAATAKIAQLQALAAEQLAEEHPERRARYAEK